MPRKMLKMQECELCKGVGAIEEQSTGLIVCHKCKGKGYVVKTTYIGRIIQCLVLVSGTSFGSFLALFAVGRTILATYALLVFLVSTLAHLLIELLCLK